MAAEVCIEAVALADEEVYPVQTSWRLEPAGRSAGGRGGAGPRRPMVDQLRSWRGGRGAVDPWR
ncbi:MAG: hypothetical protein J7452_06185 [Thermoflexus sp.]|jgi:hypothetical protein|nr:hypothetical protein [Thermoflexus sp.]